MNATLKHTLNPGFALLFAVGVERLYRILDPIVFHYDQASSGWNRMRAEGFYFPLTMVLLTLLVGSLSAISNERLIEKKQSAKAMSPIAWLSYASIFCALWMFYFSVDLGFVKYWWLGYAFLCAVNAVWNWLAIERTYARRHVLVNVIVAMILLGFFFLYPSVLHSSFYLLLLGIGILKFFQRFRDQRFSNIK